MPAAIDELIDALCCLPGVGRKSARRMAYHLLERDREGGRRLSGALASAMERVGHCQSCRTLTDGDLCPICAGGNRDRATLCVVETPADVAAIEQATGYRGLYFVLMGHLSPLDGVGPDQLGIDLLAERMAGGGVDEIILATNPTVEGEATAHYIGELARRQGVRTTRIAHGVPLGGELEYIDGGTLQHAFTGRREL